VENKWLKELPISKKGKYSTAGQANDPTFSTIEEINIAFQSDILQRKETWKHFCHICDYVTNTKHVLTTHLAVHGIGERFKCEKCEKDFSQRGQLKIHRERHNSSSRKKCNQCGKLFTAEKGLKAHIQHIHAEKHLKCGQCDLMFSTTWVLNQHKKRVHVLKSFKCDQCKYRAKTKHTLTVHIKWSHDGVRDAKAGKCDLCDYQGTMSHLKTHKESTHENKKNWFCKACPYSTYFKQAFQTHMQIHTGEKPYQCETCHKNFTRLSTAKAHCKSLKN